MHEDLLFTPEDIAKLQIYVDLLLKFNKSYNLIGKNTENAIWSRHILDSAQLVRYIDFKSSSVLSDLGTGAGLPGIVLAIFNKNNDFHVKLYEKSPIKGNFLGNIIKELKIKNVQIKIVDVFKEKIERGYIVCRAFKKFDKLIQVSREIAQKPHKFIILKGKNAQVEIKKTFKKEKFRYIMRESITDKDSKIIIINA